MKLDQRPNKKGSSSIKKRQWRILIAGLGGVAVLLAGLLTWLVMQPAAPKTVAMLTVTPELTGAPPAGTTGVPYPALNQVSATPASTTEAAKLSPTILPAITVLAATPKATSASITTTVKPAATVLLPSTTPVPSSVISSVVTPPAATKVTVLANRKIQAEYQNLGLIVIYEPESFGATHLGEFIANWQEALTYVRDRLKVKNPPPMTFELRTDGAPDPLGLGVRGFSDTSKNRVYQLYDGSGDSPDRRYITAHELGHILMNYKVGGPGANLMLIEGLAMYASDEFLRRAGMVTLHDFAVAAYEQKRLPTLGSLSQPNADYNGRLTARLDYDLAGSFVSWLIETYGQEKFDKMYPGATYSTVYGKNLTELNQEWVKFLADRSKNQPLDFDSARYFGYLDRVSAAYQRLYASAAKNNNKLNPTAYEAVDNARLATDRLDFAEAEKQLQQFEKTLPA